MKKFTACVAAIVLATLTGCNQGTSGGPGATNPSSGKAVVGPAEDTFRLDPPNLGTTIKQGETRAVEIGIKRGKNFDQDVELKFGDVPQGVTIDPATAMIKHGEKEAKINVKAADNAALGSFTIKVTGHPTKGADAANDFKIKVEQK